MGRGAIILGFAFIIFAVIILIKGSPVWPALILIVIGLALIIFWKEEEKN